MRAVSILLVASACGGGAQNQPTTPAPPVPTTQVGETPPTPPAAAVAPENDASVCANRPDQFGALVLDADQAARRRGRTITKFSLANTTKAKPLEVCGIGQQRAWLMAALCDDGSRPYRDAMAIADSRRGNVGAGGTCGTVIDLYVATCPEKEYEIHIDMYHCGPGESLM